MGTIEEQAIPEGTKKFYSITMKIPSVEKTIELRYLNFQEALGAWDTHVRAALPEDDLKLFKVDLESNEEIYVQIAAFHPVIPFKKELDEPF